MFTGGQAALQHNGATLVVKSLGHNSKAFVHNLCDLLGLSHRPCEFGKKANQRVQITIPDGWAWEFTSGANPAKFLAAMGNKTVRRRGPECDECGTQDGELMRSIHCRVVFCYDCLDVASDGEGGKM